MKEQINLNSKQIEEDILSNFAKKEIEVVNENQEENDDILKDSLNEDKSCEGMLDTLKFFNLTNEGNTLF